VATAEHPTIAVTMGDPAGIGPEIVAKLVAAPRKKVTTVIVGDQKLLDAAARAFNIKLGRIHVISRPHRAKFVADAVNFVQVKVPGLKNVNPGEPDARTGAAAMAFVEKATDLALLNEVDAVVTAPISKKAINDAGFHFAGHTEYFATRTNTAKYAMCFVADELRVAVVTGHVPVRKIHSNVKLSRVLRTLSLLDNFLRTLGVDAPRLALTGLNPHAGESGLLGAEELGEIAPAVPACSKLGINVTGPLSAEAAFVRHIVGEFDGVVAMFHDQGLVPLKVLAPHKAVNVTIGLPFIRTSPGHGAAWDIAGRGIARADSLKNAVTLAAKLARLARAR